MTSRLHKIEITNFKAFKETFTLDLEGRHLLLYGQNGSGKSSLYWALYTFLQSARKHVNGIAKYFDPGNDQNLLNIHTTDHAASPGEIAFTFRNPETGTETTHHLSQALHSTRNAPFILKGDLASDFITYRFFFGFSHFRNSDRFNVWPLFEQEILPFCVSTSGENPQACWNAIKNGDPNPAGSRGRGGSYAYGDFQQKTNAFAELLPGIIDTISAEAQKFYDRHFAIGDPSPVTLRLKVTQMPSFTGTNQHNADFRIPVIEFGVQLGGRTISRPQSFLNEAKLTQLALSVRFAASLVNLHESDLKLLVLDDLLVSLDMSNRMKVVQILLSEEFAGYQKIILTHDLGLFQEFSRCIRAHHQEWSCQKLTGTSATMISATPNKTELQKAEEYLHGYNLEECGNRLRKHVEENLATFLAKVRERKGLDPLYDCGEFASLHQKLNEAVHELGLASYRKFADLLQGRFTLDQLSRIASPSEIDPNTLATPEGLSKRAKGKYIAKLLSARTDLHQCIVDLLSDASRKQLNAIRLLEEVRNIKDRILNPASHAGATPLYEKEAEDAIVMIQKLDQALVDTLATITDS